MANLFDATNAPTEIPRSFTVGDFVQWKNTTLGTDYPNTAYTVTFLARSATGTSNEFSVTATASDDDYLFTILSTTSDDYNEGHYHYQLEVLRNSDSARIIVDTGEIDVEPDLDVSSDPREHAEKMLNKIEAVLENRADGDLSSYSIAGRSLTKMSPDELLTWRDYYRREVKAIKRKIDVKHGRKTSSTILMRF
tara:strand:+ start:223 stop:804 length:582 start_codon:yes stop_codon:yes gene_type:complete